MITFVDQTKPKAGGMAKVLGSFQPATSEPVGYCPGAGCATLVPLRTLVCRECIDRVPDKLLDAYWDTFVPGQDCYTASAANNAAYAAIMAHFAQSVTA